MSKAGLDLFEKQAYLNLETFRKSGAGVPTPVWFAESQGVLYVRTIDGSGKVKRIRNNGRVRVAPCDARGGLLGEWREAQAHLVSDRATIDEVYRLLGEWREAQAHLVSDRATIAEVDRLLDRKYGFQRTMFSLLGRMRNQKGATIAIEVC